MRFVDQPPRADHLDQRAALHRADERRAAPRQRALVSGTPGSRYRDGRRSVTGSRTRRPARHSSTRSRASEPTTVTTIAADPGGTRCGGHAGAGLVDRRGDRRPTLSETPLVGRRGVGAQHALHDRERLVVFRKPAAFVDARAALPRGEFLERDAQRRAPRALPGARPRAAHRRRRSRRPRQRPAHAAAAAPRPGARRRTRSAATIESEPREVRNEADRTAAPASRPMAGMAATVRTRSRGCKFGAATQHEDAKVTKQARSSLPDRLRGLRVFVPS